MKLMIFILAALSLTVHAFANEHEGAAPVTIVIHGGAGALEPGRYTQEEEAAYKAKLREALNAGYAVLNDGDAAMDAVEAAIVIMEDSPYFNAGKGAVFTREGTNELDSSVMDGATLNAGAVAGVTRIKNPIKLARAVMENSVHVMFTGEGAEEFAKEQDVEFVEPEYFHTDRRWSEYENALARENESREGALPQHLKYGTVGAVALDMNGNLAAGTSTGGMTLKRYGRVGDVPIIGAGTFADNNSCAVSSTGWGEYFMRLTIARDICAQVEYKGVNIKEAANDVIHNRLENLGGNGGVIVLAPDGAYEMTFNSAGMFRGVKNADTEDVAIYKE
ncbi:isoaspartyl peptidase/L-asparaginase family protein [Hyphococcus sp.]|uniref:isoaspartyl peptidase/L-asparaginase family protein n=1 Tax=Hyphococcus sp. TaxID=2038636 RepID=UPI003CCBFD91